MITSTLFIGTNLLEVSQDNVIHIPKETLYKTYYTLVVNKSLCFLVKLPDKIFMAYCLLKLVKYFRKKLSKTLRKPHIISAKENFDISYIIYRKKLQIKKDKKVQRASLF